MRTPIHSLVSLFGISTNLAASIVPTYLPTGISVIASNPATSTLNGSFSCLDIYFSFVSV